MFEARSPTRRRHSPILEDLLRCVTVATDYVRMEGNQRFATMQSWRCAPVSLRDTPMAANASVYGAMHTLRWTRARSNLRLAQATISQHNACCTHCTLANARHQRTMPRPLLGHHGDEAVRCSLSTHTQMHTHWHVQAQTTSGHTYTPSPSFPQARLLMCMHAHANEHTHTHTVGGSTTTERGVGEALAVSWAGAPRRPQAKRAPCRAPHARAPVAAQALPLTCGPASPSLRLPRGPLPLPLPLRREPRFAPPGEAEPKMGALLTWARRGAEIAQPPHRGASTVGYHPFSKPPALKPRPQSVRLLRLAGALAKPPSPLRSLNWWEGSTSAPCVVEHRYTVADPGSGHKTCLHVPLARGGGKANGKPKHLHRQASATP